MKIELNSSRMTIDELTDCINELSAQRARLIEEQRSSAEFALTLAFTEFLVAVEKTGFDVKLNVKTSTGRTRRMTLTPESIESWGLLVTPKEEDTEED